MSGAQEFTGRKTLRIARGGILFEKIYRSQTDVIHENLQLVLSDEMVAAIQPLQFTPAQVHAGVL